MGDRDAAPRHSERAWRAVSVNHRECLGASRCPYAEECFAERARAEAWNAHVVVTNHAMLAIDAVDGVPMLPDHDAVVVDEAHELAARVTQASTAELGPVLVERAARRARNHVEGNEADDLTEAADALSEALAHVEAGRIDTTPEHLQMALENVRDAARACLSAFPREKPAAKDDEVDPGKQQAQAHVTEVRRIAERMAGKGDTEVLWVSDGPGRGGPQLHVAPLDVAFSLRDKLFSAKTVVLTSATLTVGGTFDSTARGLGSSPATRCCRGAAWTSGRRSTTAARACCTSPSTSRCRGATGWWTPSSTRSPSWSRRRADARWDSSRRDGRPSGRPRPRASGCPTWRSCAKETPS